jgi:nicotinamide-nucleotide amidase
VNAEIIAVGSEMLTPSKLDTNSLFLTARLNELGVEVQAKSIVGDDPHLLTAAIRIALDRSEIVILSGGLGPTMDDLTREAASAATSRPLEFHGEILRLIEARFRRMNRTPTENNRKQAEILEGAEILVNPNGTAPGQWIEASGRVLMLLPGPPREIEPMFVDQCLPRLRALLPPVVIRTLFWRITGLGESQVDALVAPVYSRYSNPVTTILASLGDIQLHLRAHAATAAEADALLDPVAREMEPLLGDHLYSKEGLSLEEVIAQRLVERGETLAVAESVTGGMVSTRLTAVPGASRWFAGSMTAYTEGAKVRPLGVDPEILQLHSAVSGPVAEQMATRARVLLDADWGIATTGFAGPEGGDPDSPVGTVFLASSHPSRETQALKVRFLGDRERVRQLSTQAALDLLRRQLA